jgi:pimeloyl-ACP methyl ester carboxylesterase
MKEIDEMDEMMVANGDVTLRLSVTGDGPVILCVPGWPELSTSWHHQVAHLSAHGYRVAAMDVRGYGGSSAPPEVERYTLRELAGDVAAVAAALDDGPIVLVGHDWGAPIVWNAAVRYPDRVRAVAGLSVPYTAALPFSILDFFDQLYPDRFFYMLHFQEPGRAESEFEYDMRAALKRVYFALSGEAPLNSLLLDAPRGAPFLPLLPDPPDGPLGFLTDDDLDEIASVFVRTGLTGAFNRYRALSLDVAASADIVGVTVDQPSCFIAGERDPVRALLPGVDSFADPGSACTDFRADTIIGGAGHWVHQEAPVEVNAALDAFLDSI